MSDPRIVNVSELPWTPWAVNDAIGAEIRDPARKVGSTKCGFRLYRLAPGKQSARLHRHLLQEEMFFVLSGNGTLRHGDRSVPIKAGDFILYPAGDPAAHTIVNTSDAPLEYVATGDRLPYEVCEYPEDGTLYVEAVDKTVKNEEAADDRKSREAWFKAGR